MIESMKLLDTQRSALEASAAAGGLVKDGGRWKRADGLDNGTYATSTLRKLYTLGLVRMDEVNGRAEATAKGAEVIAPRAPAGMSEMRIVCIPASRPEAPLFGLAEPMPYPHEVRAWETHIVALETIERLKGEYDELAQQLRRTGAYSINDIGAGDLVREADEAVALVATDIHKRGRTGEGRKVVITIKGEPAEGSAGIAWEFTVVPHLAKYEGGGVAYLDKNGRLVRPEDINAEQIMLPISPDEPAAVIHSKKAA